jgi:hypothetical protein
MKTKIFISLIGLLALFSSIVSAAPLGTAFTYQGRLTDSGTAYTGNAELAATLWDVASGGTALASNVTGSVIVGVSNGLFVLPLDFGTNFPGDVRWLQLEVRTAIGPFTTLTPRQPLTPTPYALYAPNAGTAGTASSMPAGNLTGTLSDERLSGNVALLNGNQPFTGANTFANAGNSFTGNGSGLTALNADNLGSGTVPDARLFTNIPRLNNHQTFSGNNIFTSGNNSFAGDGSGLTSLNADHITSGTLPGGRLSGLYSGAVTFNNAGNSFVGSFNGTGAGLTGLNANNLASGTLPDARLSGIYTFNLTFNNPANNFIGNGAGLTSLNANNLTSGALPDARLSGVYSSGLSFSNPGNNFTGNGSGLTALNANNLMSGTLPSERLSGPYSSAVTFNNAGNSFTGSGSSLTSLNAGNLSSGTVSDLRLSANVDLLSLPQTFAVTKTFNMAPSFAAGAGAPFTVASSTLVVNLNADMLDGSHGSAFAPASGSANYIQNQTAVAQAANLRISGTATAGSFTGNGVNLTNLGASSLNSDAASLAKVSGGNLAVASSSVGVGVTPSGSYKLQVNGKAYASDGLETGQGASGTGTRFGSTAVNTTTTLVSLVAGDLIWNSTAGTLSFTNKNALVYIHYAGHKNEGSGGAFLNGYVLPNSSTTLATLDTSGEYIVVDISDRNMNGAVTLGFVHVYGFYDNGRLVAQYFYHAQ